MTMFDSVVKEVLTWQRPRLFRREYDLRVKEQQVAVLRQTGFFNGRAEIYEGLDGRTPVLELGRSGMFRQKLHVKVLDYRFPHITKPAPLNLRGETWLALENGRNYHFQPTNFWQTRWTLTDDQGQEYLALQRNNWGFGGTITIAESDLSQDELLFLIYVAWYITILKMEDQSAAAAAAS
ncbi:MAG: hypothetical protein H6662_03150 [Ardenticatenaceae bacterium]|nr:hypothetical protein [Ardenticatenaceae bacterium]MCB8990181.1 hypothetical protein [Ardenticatenaceae bacterium]MCB9003028.1 hypothetical protein [Ardenticatenaceae bacterium]